MSVDHHATALAGLPPRLDAWLVCSSLTPWQLHAGVLPELVGLLASTASMPERLEAAHALSSIAAGNADVAHAVVELQPLPHLLALLMTPDLSAQSAAAMCLAELTEQCHMQVRNLIDLVHLPKSCITHPVTGTLVLSATVIHD